MVTKWSKQGTHEKWGAGKEKLKTKHERNKSPRRVYIIVNWGKQWHIRTMGMRRKPQNIFVIVGLIRLLPHLMVPSYHHTLVTFPVGDLFFCYVSTSFYPFPLFVCNHFSQHPIYIYIYV